jgi:hypothetical protein
MYTQAGFNLTTNRSASRDHSAAARATTPQEGSFLNGFSRLREKLAPRHEDGAYANVGLCEVDAYWRLSEFRKLASGQMIRQNLL